MGGSREGRVATAVAVRRKQSPLDPQAFCGKVVREIGGVEGLL